MKLPSRQQVDDFVKAAGGDPDVAILEIARSYGVAVAYLNREWFNDHFEYELRTREGADTFTDQEWGDISTHLEGYDEFVSGGEINADFAQHVIDKARIDLGED